MEIDSTTVPPPQEYSDSPIEHLTAMNCDTPRSTTEAISCDNMIDMSSLHHCTIADEVLRSNIGYGASASSSAYGGVFNEDRLIDSFVAALNQLDLRVEKFRREALALQEKRDFLLMSIDVIKSNEQLQSMSESEREEIICNIHRVNGRLSTVDLNVRTVRDSSQEDSLSRVNSLIDLMITMGNPLLSLKRCQQYLNSCMSSFEYDADGSVCYSAAFKDVSAGDSQDLDIGPIDENFERALLGCTLDDQKTIKKRLQALMAYLGKQAHRD